MTKTATLVWKRLRADGRRLTTRAEIADLAQTLGYDLRQTIDYLQRHGYIIRILRGIFYVCSADERQRKTIENNVYDLVAQALYVKEVKGWYFALGTALRMNSMTHEFFAIDEVFTTSYRTTKTIGIQHGRFRFHLRSRAANPLGIIHHGKRRFSDPERTVLDLAYERFRQRRSDWHAPLAENEERIRRGRLAEYAGLYPRIFQEALDVRR